MPTNIDSLSVTVSSDSSKAAKGIEKLAASLEKLHASLSKSGAFSSLAQVSSAVNGVREKIGNAPDKLIELAKALSQLGKIKTSGFSQGTIDRIGNLATAVRSLPGNADKKFADLSAGIGSLSAMSKVTISPTIAREIGNIGAAMAATEGVDFARIGTFASAVSTLSTVGDIKVSKSIADGIFNIGAAIDSTAGVDFNRIAELTAALKPLSELGKTQLGPTLTQLERLPNIFEALRKMDMSAFAESIRSLTDALRPLSDVIGRMGDGFTKLPERLRNLTSAMEVGNGSGAGKGGRLIGRSLTEIAAGLGIAHIGIRGFASALKSAIGSANSYIEDVNLFTASLGKFAGEAEKYAQKVSNVMGIDPAKWMRNQGVFMTLAQGFGVAGDRAYTMSQQLTQLGYDLSSFFNIAVDGEGGSMQKLQAGLAGELEPLRRLGFDLSQTRLQAIAASLGIEKLYTQMNQAEKSQLRYYAIMTQVTTAQGDMARTLNAPSNQMRIFSAQLQMAARAIGNIFIPAMNAILPIAIAVVKVVRLAAEAIASFFGYTLPEIDYSGLQEVAGGFDDIGTAAEGAGGAAKKLKSYLMGFDELNVIDPNQGSGGGGGGGSGGGAGGSDWDFPLPTYDFLGDAIESKVDSIMAKIKPAVDWISEHVELVLTTIGLIGATIMAWKFANGFLAGLADTHSWLSKIAGLIPALATIPINVLLTYNFDKKFSETGDLSYVIGSSLVAAFAALVGKKLVTGAFGVDAGWKFAGLSLTISAATTLTAFFEDSDLSQFSWEEAVLGLTGVLKAGLGFAFSAKGFGASTGQMLTSAGAVVAAIGVAVSLKALYDSASKPDLSEFPWVTVASVFTSTLTSMATGGLMGKLLGFSPLNGSVAGAAIGLALAIGVYIAAKSAKDKNVIEPAVWGDMNLSAEEVRKYAESLFAIDVDATVSVINTHVSGLDQARDELSMQLEELGSKIRLINLGVGVDKASLQDTYDYIFGEGGMVSTWQSVLQKEENFLTYGVSLVPEELNFDAAGFLEVWQSSTDIIMGEIDNAGAEVVRIFNAAQDRELEASEQEQIQHWLTYIQRLQQATAQGEIFGDYDYGVSKLPLEKLSRDSFLDALKEWDTISANLWKGLDDVNKQQVMSINGRIAQLQLIVDEHGTESEVGQRAQAAIESLKQQLDGLLAEGVVDAEWKTYTADAQGKFIEFIGEAFEKPLENVEFSTKIRTALNKATDEMWFDTNQTSKNLEEYGTFVFAKIHEAITNGMSDEDKAVYVEAQKILKFKDWDMLGADAKNSVIQQLQNLGLDDDTIRAIFKQQGIELGDSLIEGVTDTVSGRGSGSKKGRPGRAGQALGEEIKTGFAAKLGGILTEAANKTNRLPSIFRSAGVQSKTKFNDGLDAVDMKELSAKVKLVKEGWTTVTDFVTGAGMSAVQQAISLIKHGWSTVSGYTESHKGSETVDEGVTLYSEFGDGAETVFDWLTGKAGATFMKAVGLSAGWGSTTVTGWLGSAGVAGGLFSKPVGLTKDFGGKDTVTEWVSQSLGSGSVDVIAKVKRSLVHGGVTYTGAAQWLTGTSDGSVSIRVRRTGDALNGFSVTQGEEVVNGISKSSVVVREPDKSDTDARNVDIIAAIYTLIDAVNDKEMNVSIGDKDIYDANNRYERKRGYVTNPGQFQNSY